MFGQTVDHDHLVSTLTLISLVVQVQHGRFTASDVPAGQKSRLGQVDSCEHRSLLFEIMFFVARQLALLNSVNGFGQIVEAKPVGVETVVQLNLDQLQRVTFSISRRFSRVDLRESSW